MPKKGGGNNNNNNNNNNSLYNLVNNSVNNNSSSKKKSYTTLIVILVVLLILAILVYVAYRYINHKKITGVVTKEIIPFIYDAKKITRYSYGSLPISTEKNSYNYNMWIYINDYDYRSGDDKCVLMKGTTVGGNDEVNPGIYLLKNTNTLRIKVSLDTLYKNTTCENENKIKNEEIIVENNNDYYLGSENGNGDAALIENFSDIDSNTDYCDIKYFPLQKWVSLNVALTNNIVNISIDGKLVKSCTMKGAPQVLNRDLLVSPNGGFNGFIANLKVSSKELNPNEIYNIYKSGPRLKATILS